MNPSRIINLVGGRFDVSAAALLAAGRGTQATSRARHVCMYLLRAVGGESYQAIGRRFGRDHSTVIHACRRVARECRESAQFRAEVDALVSAYCQMRVSPAPPVGALDIPDNGWGTAS